MKLRNGYSYTPNIQKFRSVVRQSMQGDGFIATTNHTLLPHDKDTVLRKHNCIEEPKMMENELDELEATSLGETSNDSSRTPTPEHIDDEAQKCSEEPQNNENGGEFVGLEIQVDVEKVTGPETSLSTVSSAYDSMAQIQSSPSTSALVDENSSNGAPLTILDEKNGGDSAQVATNPKNKRRSHRRNDVVAEEASRKSTRITRNTENAIEVVNNYAGSKEHYKPRNVQYPKGIKRIPYEFPVKSFKENGRLRIDMNGPVTRANANDNSHTPLKRNSARIQDGKEYQATLPEVRPFCDASLEPDRDEAVWIPPPDETTINKRSINMSWAVIAYQYNGEIPLDAMLHRLMVCEYDLRKMLETIEMERIDLPQSFQPLSTAQQCEFEKQLKRQFGSNRANSKSFRNMQERFLRNYHLGEIVNYYYRTKKRSCMQQQYVRCLCHESLLRKLGDIADRIECANCTKLYRSRVNPESRCAICTVYRRLFKEDRAPIDFFLDEESQLLRLWNEMEEHAKFRIELSKVEQEMEIRRCDDIASRPLTTDETAAIGNAKRKDRVAIAKLLAPYRPHTLELCSHAPNSFSNCSIYRMKEYSSDEKLLFIRAFETNGKDPVKVSAALNIEENEAAIFFARFDTEYSISELIQNANNNNYSSNHHNSRHKEKSSRESTPYDPSAKQGKCTSRKRKSESAVSNAAKHPKRLSGPKTRSRASSNK